MKKQTKKQPKNQTTLLNFFKPSGNIRSKDNKISKENEQPLVVTVDGDEHITTSTTTDNSESPIVIKNSDNDNTYHKPSDTQKQILISTENFVNNLDTEDDFLADALRVLEEHDNLAKNNIKENKLPNGIKRKAEEENTNESKRCSKEVLESLSNGLKCQIVCANRNTKTWELQLDVETVDHKTPFTCYLRGVWCSLMIKENYIACILAKKINGVWVVDNDFGFVSLFPDILVSSTSLTGAMFCRRKGILTEYFRGLDGQNKAMVIGNLTHDLIQTCLDLKVTSETQIKNVLEQNLKKIENVQSLYSASLSSTVVKEELKVYIEKIKEFIGSYVTGNKKPKEDCFQGKITELVDIEESVAVPKIGVKGRIDLTVKVSYQNEEALVPLEIKTGRTTFSNEHVSQIALYVMMMKELGEKVDSGLLLYLKEGVMKEINPSNVTKRDLFILRNDLVQHFLPINNQKLGEPSLPDPISRKICEKCPYLTVCTTFLKTNGYDQLSSAHPLKALTEQTLSHLKEEDIQYFFKWFGLIYLEENNVTVKPIWGVSKEERKINGGIGQARCSEVIAVGDKYKHTFVSTDDSTSLSVEDYVMISTGNRYNIGSGRIVEINQNKIDILLIKNLYNRYKNVEFSIDKYPCSRKLTNLMSNLGYLLDNNERVNKIRELIISKMEPTFDKKLQKEVLTKGLELLSSLNEQQQRAVLKVIAANDYVLIEGMPGTGKTQTIVCLVHLLASLNKSVFITSHTHSAVDNVLLRLNVPFLRLGSLARIHPNIHPQSEALLTKTITTPEDLAMFYDSYSIVAATCFGADHGLFKKRVFDYLIVDESTQVLQPEILQPLFYAQKFVLIGDPNQLPPVVQSKEAKSLGMDESLFVALQNKTSTVSLTKQYRMNSEITKLANKLTYEDRLVSANEEVADYILNFSDKSKSKWMEKVCSNNIQDSVLFFDTGNVKDLPSEQGITSCVNSYEIGVIKAIVEDLKRSGIKANQIGIIAPFRAQVNLLVKYLQDVETSTVDQFQGRDKDIIIYSCTKNKTTERNDEHEILNDKRRLTVAVTRAKAKLIVVGDSVTLHHYGPFALLLKCFASYQIIKLEDNVNEFVWKKLVENIKI